MRAKDRYGVMGSAHQKVHVCHESCAKLTYEVCSSLSYFYGAKIGVLCLNGSGKSSLLRILAGIDIDFNGETVLAPGYCGAQLRCEGSAFIGGLGTPLVSASATLSQYL